jgi:chromosome segregation ATPase
MTGRRASLLWLALFGAALIVFGFGWVFPNVHRLRIQQETIDRLEREKVELAKKLENLNRQIEGLLAAEGVETETADPRLSTLSKLSAEERAKRLEQVKLLGETQDRLSNATAAIQQLEHRVQELDQSIINLEEDKRAVAAVEADLREKLADSTRLTEALQAELKSSSERASKLEARNKTLTVEQRDLQSRTGSTTKALQELETINSRREALMTGILQRYREANDRYRSLAQRLDEPQRDTPSSGLDLSQIETLVDLVEEDLRQLRSLNAQAGRVQRQLGR